MGSGIVDVTSYYNRRNIEWKHYIKKILLMQFIKN